jgi:hypothetical protein
MLPHTNLAALTGIALLFLAVPIPASDPISPEQFEKLHSIIKPHAGEAPWRNITWLTDLWEARQKAAAQGKPIFVWSASGEPQGCT